MAKKPTQRRLELNGEMNISTAAIIRQQLLDALSGAEIVEVGLGRVSECDTAGVQLMLAAKRQAAQAGKTLIFAEHSAPVVETLDLLDLLAQLGDPVLIRSQA